MEEGYAGVGCAVDSKRAWFCQWNKRNRGRSLLPNCQRARRVPRRKVLPVANVVSVGDDHRTASEDAARALDREFGLELDRLDSNATTLANSISSNHSMVSGSRTWVPAAGPVSLGGSVTTRRMWLGMEEAAGTRSGVEAAESVMAAAGSGDVRRRAGGTGGARAFSECGCRDGLGIVWDRLGWRSWTWGGLRSSWPRPDQIKKERRHISSPSHQPPATATPPPATGLNAGAKADAPLPNWD
jgi:hypothetical protein